MPRIALLAQEHVSNLSSNQLADEHPCASEKLACRKRKEIFAARTLPISLAGVKLELTVPMRSEGAGGCRFGLLGSMEMLPYNRGLVVIGGFSHERFPKGQTAGE